MMAGGNDGTDSTARVLVRRPTIRPRPVTPPRSAEVGGRPDGAATTSNAPPPTWKLPPVRLPAPRPRLTESPAEERPVLLLVADASDQFEIARRHDRSVDVTSAPRRPSLRIVALVAAAALVVLAVAGALAITGRPAQATQATSPRQGTQPTQAPQAAQGAAASKPAPAPSATSPVIPVVDVKSLPSAR